MSHAIARRMPGDTLIISTAARQAVPALLVLGLILVSPAVPAASEIAAGRVTLDSPSGSAMAFTSVTFRQTYNSPPLVFVMPGNASASEASLRIRNITTTGFELGHVVPDGSTPGWPALQVDYIAIEEGDHTLGGNRILADFVDTQRYQSKFGGASWETIFFGGFFSNTPAVLAQVQTMNNEPGADLATTSTPWLESTVDNVSTWVMNLALERAETTSGAITTDERIAYLVVADNAATTFTAADGSTINLRAERSSDSIDDSCTNISLPGFTSAPVAVATQNTRDGGDGGWVRRCGITSSNISVKIQEDVANDTDVNHTNERVGVVAFSDAFDADTGDIGFQMEAGTIAVGASASGSLGFTSVTFPETFETTPRVFVLPTMEESAPASLRLRNITTTGFEVAQVMPTGELGAAASMTVDYIAAVDGVHELDTGTHIEVGTLDTTTTIQSAPPFASGGGYTTLNFAHTGFGAAPVLLLDIQGQANESINPSLVSAPWLEVTANTVDSSSALVALERAEATSGTVASPETIAYLAIDAGVNGTVEIGGTTIDYESQRVTGIQGADNGCFARAFNGTYSANPIVGASMTSRAGGNGGWVRRCSLSTTNVGVTIDEDRANDNERGHISETVDLLVFSTTFSGRFPRDIVLSPATAASASTCVAHPVVLDVVDGDGDAVTDFTGTITLETSSNHGTWTTTGNGVLLDPTNDDGDATYTFDSADLGSVTLNLSNVHADQLVVTLTHSDSGATADTTTISFTDLRFEIESTDALGYDLIAGRNHTFSVTLWRRDSGGACAIATDYAGNTAMKAWLSLDGDDPGGTAPSLTGVTTLAAIPGAMPGATNITLGFTNGEASVQIDTTDVGKYTLNLRDDSSGFAVDTAGNPLPIDSAASNAPWITRPFAIRLSPVGNPAAAGATGPIYASAGESFDVDIAGIVFEPGDDDGSAGGTAGDGIADTAADLADNAAVASFGTEGETVSVGVDIVLPSGGNNPGLGGDSTVVSAFTNGEATASYIFNDVGIISLYGQTTDNNYLGAGSVRTARMTVATDNVGRFVPDHFSVDGTDGTFAANCTTATPFTYLGETFTYATQPTFTITPRDTTGTLVLQNYEGAFRHLSTAEVTLDFPAADSGNLQAITVTDQAPTLIENGDGTLDLILSLLDTWQYARTEIADFSPSLTITLSDIQESQDNASLDTPVPVTPTGGSMRYGRLLADNAFGSEVDSLAQTVESQYLTASGYVVNADDGCTDLDGLISTTPDSAPSGSLLDIPVAGGTTDLVVSLPLVNGNAGFLYSAPGTGNQGEVNVSVDLSPYDWLQYDWDGDAVQEAVLQRTVTFGQYRGHDRVVFWREVN